MFSYEAIPIHWVNRLGFVARKELTQRFRDADADVTAEEWAVLLILWSKGPQTPSQIADVTIRDRTTVTRLIDGMARKGMVERKTDPNDRRRSQICATPLGLALEQKLVPIAGAMIAQAQGGLSADDIATTVRTLKVMTGNLLTPSDLPTNKGTPT